MSGFSERIGPQFLTRECLGNLPGNHWIISDILPKIQLETACKVVEQCRRHPSRFYFIAYHEEEKDRGHVHFYHSCPYTGSNCRCRALVGLGFKRRARRKVFQCSAFREEGWTNWLFYFGLEKRQILYLAIGQNTIHDAILGPENLARIENYQEDEFTGSLETCGISCKDLYSTNGENEEGSQSTQGSNPGTSRGVSRGSERRNPGYKKKMMDINALMDHLEFYLVCPLNSSCELREWVQNERLNFYDRNDPDYRKAVSMVSRKFIDYSFYDFVQLYENASPVWYARNNNHYYERETSFAILDELLHVQFETDERIREFMTAVWNVCEKVKPKKNTLFLWGPANSGKTYFSQVVLAFYMNVGHVANFVRGQNFPLNDCTEKRILFWNEPSICPSAWDTVKMLTGGDPLAAKIKYSNDCTIPRTPLIINSNPNIFSNQDVWNARIYSFKWRVAPFLKDLTMYPSPICFIDLINKYVI
ncbi:NS1 [Lupine feces-associated densovirus 2]|uniref:NS1 n=1 Tax=Lupine feces-associated densovirus 2 TaxID=2017716 RepID=A0A221LEC0_9VIRU|nr:NS1 [Lupine feces-associated densovirus 2]ASM93489.1 NS1 [Lupine feces-associated densovirus 2]